MAAADQPNPLFAEAPEHVWQLYPDPLRMAASLLALILWIHQQVAARGEVFTVMHGQGNRRIPHKRHMAANSGFFKVRMRVAGQTDVVLLFSFNDLYLIGFLHGNIWRVFDDARLSHLHRRDKAAYCRNLGFDGSYKEHRWSSVPVGIGELFLTHGTISNYADRVRDGQRDEVENALFRLMVVIAEASRFKPWFAHLLALIRDYRSEVVDATVEFSSLFQNWSTNCKRIKDGPDTFKPGNGFDTYLEMLYSVSILLPN